MDFLTNLRRKEKKEENDENCLNRLNKHIFLQNLTDAHSDEHQHLIEALIGMEKVAEHINEMQRIHEEYGAIFDHLFRQHQKSSKQVNSSKMGRNGRSKTDRI